MKNICQQPNLSVSDICEWLNELNRMLRQYDLILILKLYSIDPFSADFGLLRQSKSVKAKHYDPKTLYRHLSKNKPMDGFQHPFTVSKNAIYSWNNVYMLLFGENVQYNKNSTDPNNLIICDHGASIFDIVDFMVNRHNLGDNCHFSAPTFSPVSLEEFKLNLDMIGA